MSDPRETVVTKVSAGLDTPKVAGLFVVGALLILGSLRHGFAPVRVKLGD